VYKLDICRHSRVCMNIKKNSLVDEYNDWYTKKRGKEQRATSFPTLFFCTETLTDMEKWRTYLYHGYMNIYEYINWGRRTQNYFALYCRCYCKPDKVQAEHVKHTCLLTYSLIPWSRILREKLTGFHLVRNSPRFIGTQRLITAFTSNRHLPL